MKQQLNKEIFIECMMKILESPSYMKRLEKAFANATKNIQPKNYEQQIVNGYIEVKGKAGEARLYTASEVKEALNDPTINVFKLGRVLATIEEIEIRNRNGRKYYAIAKIHPVNKIKSAEKVKKKNKKKKNKEVDNDNDDFINNSIKQRQKNIEKQRRKK